MADITIVKLKIRRGTDAQRKQIVLDNGELGYVTDPDARRLFIGDGVTFGGNPTSTKFFFGSIQFSSSNFAKAQIGDIIYDTYTTQLLVLTGINSGTGNPDYTNSQAYLNIAVKPDRATIVYDGNGRLSVANNAISAIHISSEAFDLDNGFTRASNSSPFKINIDNQSVQFTTGRTLFVNPNGVDWSLLPTTSPTPGSNLMWNDGGIVKIA